MLPDPWGKKRIDKAVVMTVLNQNSKFTESLDGTGNAGCICESAVPQKCVAVDMLTTDIGQGVQASYLKLGQPSQDSLEMFTVLTDTTTFWPVSILSCNTFSSSSRPQKSSPVTICPCLNGFI